MLEGTSKQPISQEAAAQDTSSTTAVPPVLATPAEASNATAAAAAPAPAPASSSSSVVTPVVQSPVLAAAPVPPADSNLPKTFDELKAIVMGRLMAGMPGGIPTGLANGLMIALIIGMGLVFSNSFIGDFAGPFAMAIGQTLKNAYTILLPWYIKLTVLILGGYGAVKHADLLQGTLKEMLQAAPGRWASVLGGWLIPLLSYMLTKSLGMAFMLSTGLSAAAVALKPLLDDPAFLERSINIIKPILEEYKNDFVKLAQNWMGNKAAQADIESGNANPAEVAKVLNAMAKEVEAKGSELSAQSTEGAKVLDAIVKEALEVQGPELLAALHQASAPEIAASSASSAVIAAPAAAAASAAASASAEPTQEKKGVKRGAAQSVEDTSYVSTTDDVGDMSVDGAPEERNGDEPKRSRATPTT